MKRTLIAATAATAACALSAAPAMAQVPPVGVGQSGWFWGNPQSQGNTLRAVEFAGGVGYAAGDFGTLMRTTDGGATWGGIATGVTGNLTKIRAVNADTVLIGAGCVMRRSDDRGATFRRVPFVSSESNCRAQLASFHFPTAQRGYIVLTDGTVQTTTDGGSTFGGATALPGTPATGGQAAPGDAFFTTETTGFVTVGGVIYRTTDGGNSWSQRFSSPTRLSSLFFVNGTTGYAVGQAKTILKTIDSGATWTRVTVPGDIPAGDLTQIRCAPGNVETCLVSTSTGERVLRITPRKEGSENPVDQYVEMGPVVTSISPSTRPIFAISFATATGAVGVGEGGATVASPDVGADTATPSFTTVGSRLNDGGIILSRLRATSATVAHATGDNGKLARTIDGGRTWTTAGVPTSEDLSDVWFTDANTGFSLDTAGGLRFTSDGGARWTPLDTGTVPNIAAIYAVNRDVAMLFTNRGVYRSISASDTSVAATTFDAIENSSLMRTSFKDFDRASGALFAWGTTAIWVSSDNGAKWKKVKGPSKKPRYVSVDFVSGKVGYAVTSGGRVWKTKNGGKSWSEILSAGTNRIVDMAMADGSNGFLTVTGFPGMENGGTVLRTSDGGRSWRPQLIAASPIRQLESPAAASAFSLASFSNLHATANGGDQGRVTDVTVSASPSRLTKAGNVRLTVKVAPKVQGAPVTLFSRGAKSSKWRRVSVPGGAFTKGTGAYTVTVKVRSTTHFIAQWRGDADNNGDGSPVRTVTVGRKKR